MPTYTEAIARFRQRAFWLDLGERVFWTGVEGGLSLVTVDALDIPVAYAPLVGALLAAIKSYAAKQIGQHATASTLPAELSPVNPAGLTDPSSDLS